MKNKSAIKLVLLLILSIHTTYAFLQPNWIVNPSEFEYNMTVTCQGFIPCNHSLGAQDQVAAFVDGQLRGVGYYNIQSQGQSYCFLLIYDSISFGSKIDFKLYNAEEDKIYKVIESITFSDNKIVGNLNEPFTFNAEETIDTLILTNSKVFRDLSPGTIFSQLNLLNLNGKEIDASFEIIPDSTGMHHQFFSIDKNKLLIQKELTELKETKCTILIKATDKHGCSFINSFKLQIIENISSTSNEDNPQHISFFPNPVSEVLQVKSDGKDSHITKISLIDAFGNVSVYSDVSVHQYELNIKCLLPGIYICKVEMSNKTRQIRKIIKQ